MQPSVYANTKFILPAPPLVRWFSGLVLVAPVLVLMLSFWSENIVFHDDYALLQFLLD